MNIGLGINIIKRKFVNELFKRKSSVLVVAEHNTQIVNRVTQETITAARMIGGQLTILIVGHECSAIAKSVATVKGLKKVLVAEDTAFNGFLAENLTPLILTIQKQFGFTHIMAGATVFGKSILPRVAGKLNVTAVTDVTDIKDFDTFVHPIYAGNACMTVNLKDPVKVITIRPTCFEACALQENRKIHSKLAAVVRAMNVNKLGHKNKYQMEKYQRLKQATESLVKWQALRAPIYQVPTEKYNLNLTKILRQDFIKITKSKLEEAAIVICGGRGMKSARNFNMLYDLAQYINAEVGATKAAVDAGFASSNIQIGQNGKTVAPNLYIAVGISGTGEHIAGIKNSKMIIAINKNPYEPICKIAHYILVADLFKVIPKLQTKLESQIQLPNPPSSFIYALNYKNFSLVG